MRYVYVCEKCSKQYEVEMKLSEHGQKVSCPYCKKGMKQKPTTVSFRIK